MELVLLPNMTITLLLTKIDQNKIETHLITVILEDGMGLLI